MARPRKNPLSVTLEEKEAAINKSIAECEAEIAAIKEKISNFKADLADVMKEKEERALKELREAIAASGKSVEDWIAAVKGESDK